VTYAVFAPHSIAVTQAAFLIGLLAWGVQLVAAGRLSQKRTPIDIAIFGFFACCVLSSFFSYDPMVSIKGLKSPALFFAFYFVCNKVTTLKLARFLAFAIVASCLVNVAYSAGQIAVGRGLRIDGIEAGRPLARAGVRVGDVLLEADGKKVSTLEDLLQTADSGRGRIQIKYQRNEALLEGSVSRRAIRKADDEGGGGLGITVSPGRNFRVTGLYSHYETYAEVLQLIAALAIGLLIAHPAKRSGTAWFLAVSILLTTTTLLLTSTRATMIGLAAAAAAMALASSRRRAFAVAILAIVIMAPAAMMAIERSRGSILFDPQEGSTAYRLEVWREALGLIKDHPLLGIGKGSEGKLKEKLGLYDDGRLPPGHFHSTPIQVATWWGLPALAFYFSLMSILIAEAWRLSRRLKEQNRPGAWGISIGVLGALVAFNVSSLVHFNFGDGEVVMMIWLLTGLLFAVRRIVSETSDGQRTTTALSQAAEVGLHRSRPRELKVASGSSAQAAGARPNS
jgi:membrane-associated protease RseP (regulator of RpoE activity)